jgi:arylsulfatase A-like enzyme
VYFAADLFTRLPNFLWVQLAASISTTDLIVSSTSPSRPAKKLHWITANMKQPNILFIMADDHASKAISCYGAEINSTPHIDRIATEGMRFNHCYVTNSICTPSRAAILTGTYNHVNRVVTLDSNIDKYLPNVAKSLRADGYQTAMVGKWHLGEGVDHQPTGFDYWSVLPGQGSYYDPEFIGQNGSAFEEGYVTDIITSKSLDWIDKRDRSRPFFLMCHHKAPHRSWEPQAKHKHLYRDEIRVPVTYNDDYKHRAAAAAAAKMRVDVDLTYFDLGLAQPDGGKEVGEQLQPGTWERKVPCPEDVTGLRFIDRDTGEAFTFTTQEELRLWKYQRYMQRYLRTIQSIDDNVGQMLDYLDQNGLTDDTVIIYTSDQGFFLGDHGWFDKRFMYEESFQMPFLVRYPREIAANSICNDVVCNVDFAATWLDLAGIPLPSYMQGRSFRSLWRKETPQHVRDAWPQIAYHRYWMHQDSMHNTYAHYGVRDLRYKLIYWYNEGLGLPGTLEGGQEKEWELFDCEIDPLELFNLYDDPDYADIVKTMTAQLDKKMREIGDEPIHSFSK